MGRRDIEVCEFSIDCVDFIEDHFSTLWRGLLFACNIEDAAIRDCWIPRRRGSSDTFTAFRSDRLLKSIAHWRKQSKNKKGIFSINK